MELNHKSKTTYLGMLIKISLADGKWDKKEEHFFNYIAQKHGIPKNERMAILKFPDNYINELPNSYYQRIEFFYNLLFMMGIDNEITEKEKAICKEIGFKLCFNPSLMDDMIEIVTANLGKKVPVNDILKAVIKYQN